MIKRIVTKIEPVPFTKEGFEKIQKEQEELLLSRVDAIGHLQKSRELGDLKENGYYQASRQKVNAIDARLRRIKFLLKYGVIKESSDTGIVEIGSEVTISSDGNEFTYKIVGGEESDPSSGAISHKSPLGRALLGNKSGQTVIFHAPVGDITYKILKVK
jgi:transcription elongation factor GreA